MAVIRGGRKGSKPYGSCRRKHYSVSSKIREGLVNTASGEWVPFAKARVPVDYWVKQQAQSCWANQRNIAARAKR